MMCSKQFAPFRIALAIGVVAVTITAGFAIFNVFRWARVADLTYPVLAIRADGSHAFAASRSELIVRPATEWADSRRTARS
jgi:hypothetical protein